MHIRLAKTPNTAKTGRRVVKQAEEILLTEEGLRALEAELQQLIARRPQLAVDRQRAMDDKDFRENAPLDAIREQQAYLESRIREIEAALAHATLLEHSDGPKSEVNVGNTVHLRNLKSGKELKYTLVNPREVSPAQGKISVESPVGRALIRRQEGEEIEVTAPVGSIHFRIEKIEA